MVGGGVIDEGIGRGLRKGRGLGREKCRIRIENMGE